MLFLVLTAIVAIAQAEFSYPEGKDPKADFFRDRDRILAELDTSPELAKSISYMFFPDSRVQLKCWQIRWQQKSISASEIVAFLKSSVSSAVWQTVLQDTAKQKPAGYDQIESLLIQSVTDNAFNTLDALVKALPEWLTANNIADFRAAAQKMPAGRYRKAVLLAIQDFDEISR